MTSPAELELARQYLLGSVFWGTLSEFWLFFLLALLFYSGASRWLRRRLRWRAPVIQVGAVALALAVTVLIGLAPIDYYAGFIRERAFGFEHRAAWAWWGDWGRAALIDAGIGLLLAEAFYWLLRRWRRRSSPAPVLRSVWLWAITMVLVIAGVALEPIFIAPLFNHFTEISDPVERARIVALAGRAGIPARHIYEMDASRQSGHTNAYVVGILGTERIVIYDTLLQTQTPDEIDFTLGHEMGHYVLHHLWKGIGFTAALSLALFLLLPVIYGAMARGFQFEDPAGTPLLALIVTGLIFFANPITNAFSRWEEHQADAFGLKVAPNPCAAVTSFEREEHTDLIYPNPPSWIVDFYFTHPTQQQRIDFAQSFCNDRH